MEKLVSSVELAEMSLVDLCFLLLNLFVKSLFATGRLLLASSSDSNVVVECFCRTSLVELIPDAENAFRLFSSDDGIMIFKLKSCS